MLGRLWNRLWAIERLPIYHDVEVAFYAPNHDLHRGDKALLANGTTWFVMDFERPGIFIGLATEPLTAETVRQMQDYHGDAVIYSLACPDDQEERLFNRNPYV